MSEQEEVQQFNIDEFRKNVISAIGDNAVALSAFVRVADIIVDKSIPTACITLEGVPEIHVNPDFVMEHALTPEHQFILVYHEIMHMVLRHGIKIRCKRDNIIADAMINSMICMHIHRQGILGSSLTSMTKRNSQRTYYGPILSFKSLPIGKSIEDSTPTSGFHGMISSLSLRKSKKRKKRKAKRSVSQFFSGITITLTKGTDTETK
jgi:hypothetical protein